MRKFLIILICLFVFSATEVHAESYIVISLNDNTVLEEENAHEIESVASISKVMTALVALEKGNLADVWTVGDEIYNNGGININLTVGQKVNMQDLLYGMMLKSGCDAANAIAYRVGGDIESFVEMMNDKAQELGMLNTEFHNPTGLDVAEEGNYSTAYDMALCMAAAMKNETFREIVATKDYTSQWGTKWKNSNKLLDDFAFCTGGKTGYTKKAGNTLVTSASYEGAEYVIVTLQIGDRYEFHKEKYTQIMNEYKLHTILEEQEFELDGYRIVIDEPFVICANQSMMTDGEFLAYLDEESSQYIVEYNYKNIQIIKMYEAEKIKKKFCFWRFCV